ncbi:MAG: drug/metabolite exporter YedA [Alphaproteobacteria bacterium]|uniref:Drug/metabolite exporter YedA n=1 Tax=Candidatus Nitrobium versatile TaxID=2884831 RepID=A0A953LXU6_9BACT|nr:drug/metabolite exporter YedA [Candidatus Nitrobium versatile]
MQSAGEVNRGRVVLALLAVYFIWGSNFLAQRIALEGFPPFFLSGIRYLCAGLCLYLFLRVKGAPAPPLSHWKNTALIGTFLICGNGGVVFGQQWIASGVSALVMATIPLWTVLFAGIWGRWPTRFEWVGLLVGLAGVALLYRTGDVRAHPEGAVALLTGALLWAFGSAWSRHLRLPGGLMEAAMEMIAGSTVLIAVGVLNGERLPALPGWRPAGALVYLILFGSLVGFSSYVYLLCTVRPALATSYAYVNPVVAVLLGIWLAGESISGSSIVSMMIILAGVMLVALGQKPARARAVQEGRT